MGQLRKIAFLLAVGLSVAAIGCGSSDDLPGTSASGSDAAAGTDGATSGGTGSTGGDSGAAKTLTANFRPRRGNLFRKTRHSLTLPNPCRCSGSTRITSPS